MSQFGEAIGIKKKIELTDEQKAKLEEQRKAFIIVEKKEDVKGPKPMKDNERIKLLQYTLKVPEALIGYRVLVFLTDTGLTGTGVVMSCIASILRGTAWVIKFEDGTNPLHNAITKVAFGT